MLRLSSLASVLLLVGCADSGDEGMTVLNNTAVSGTCALTGDPGQPFKSHGQIYAFSPSGYLLTPLIESRVSADISTMGTNHDASQRTIFLDGADVSLTLEAVTVKTAGSYTNTNPGSSLGHFSVYFAGSIPPSGSANVGFEVITPKILQDVIVASGANVSTSDFTAEVLATVTVKGKLGGDPVTSQPFTYPISVCTDCVVSNLGACPKTATNTGNACNIFQDGVVDCCTDANMNLICPATTATTP